MSDQNSKNSGMMLMIIATSLCNKYDEWKNDINIMSIVDLNSNSICVGLKKIYPTIEDKITQSIALAFTMYFIITMQDNYNNCDYQKNKKEIKSNDIEDLYFIDMNNTNLNID